MTDVRLDDDHDLYYADGLLDTVEDYEEALQSLEIALRTGLGEWLYDTDAGTAYRQLLRGKNPGWAAIEAEVRRVCTNVAGITALRGVEFNYEPVTRTLEINADTIYGEVSITTVV